MKLYRGLKSIEYSPVTESISKKLHSSWRKILTKRAKGDFSYPKDLNSEILELSRLIRLQDQYFTDRKEIAEGYARSEKGILIQIDVPSDDILEHFKIEFQNFSQRAKVFELVYRVRGELLAEKAKKWKLKKITFSTESGNGERR